MAEQVYVAHYGELVLKGKNRGYFEGILVGNLRKKLGEGFSIRRESGRLIIAFRPEDEETVSDALSHLMGIKNYAKAYLVDNQALFKEVPELVPLDSEFPISFRVTAKRADKTFPMSSLELQKKLGELVLERHPQSHVDLTNPALNLNVEVMRGKSLVYWEKRQGLGGLPVGSSGRTLALFSGGIDSPVAAFLAMKRGCRTDLLHFHAFPSSEQVRGTKIEGLARALSSYEPSLKLILVPYHYFYVYFLNYPDKYHLVLFRRFMMRVASRIAQQRGYDALVTGDSLSQVASQIMKNLKLIDEAADALVLRPLITYDKDEIVEKAKEIGTYEMSIQPYRDCCSMVAIHPSLNPVKTEVEDLERKVDYEEIVEKTLSEAEEVTFDRGVAASSRRVPRRLAP